MTIEQLLFDVSDALRVPVLVASLVCLLAVAAEGGALLAELWRRRGRGFARLEREVDFLRTALVAGERGRALVHAERIAYSQPMYRALFAVVELAGRPDTDDRIAKHLAEYDYRSLRRLERTRILVRLGPALGLMGTLIPLSPALAGLAAGDVQRLTEDLRVAFSVTVAGLLVGAIAFTISMVRDRLYAQDFSDVEYAASVLTRPVEQPPVAAPELAAEPTA